MPTSYKPYLRSLTVAALLTVWPTCSTGCTRRVLVPAPREPIVCPLPPFPPFPGLEARACGEDVCLTPDEGAAVWAWARNARRWSALASACLEAR
jgi:hypothetical protein